MYRLDESNDVKDGEITVGRIEKTDDRFTSWKRNPDGTFSQLSSHVDADDALRAVAMDHADSLRYLKGI
jgi:hypothetical protein